MKEIINDILEKVPHCKPFRFIDSIQEVSADHIIGECFLDEDSFYFKGHFPANPITPGYIITEAMAQIGILGLGIYLVNEKYSQIKHAYLVSTDVKFYNVSFPNDNIIVKAYKIFFRFGKLKCRVSAYNQNNVLLCEGILSGVIK